jgi:telomere length regulation protein
MTIRMFVLLVSYRIRSNSFILFGEDTFILSRLIHTAGVLVYCCGTDAISHQLARDVLDFTWTVRYQFHVQGKQRDTIQIIPKAQEEESASVVAVRRSVLASMMHSLNALPPKILIEDIGLGVLEQYLNWLGSESQEDPDDECRELAATNISILRSKLGR